MKSFLLGLLLFTLIAGGAVLAWTLLTLRGCTIACAPTTPSAPTAAPIRSFTSSGVVRGLELAEVRPAAANTSGSRGVTWEGQSLRLSAGEHFLVKKADIYLERIGLMSAEGTGVDDGVLQHTILFEIADVDQQRFRDWIDARIGLTMAICAGGAPICVARISQSLPAHGALSEPSGRGWTEAEASAIATSLCP